MFDAARKLRSLVLGRLVGPMVGELVLEYALLLKLGWSFGEMEDWSEYNEIQKPERKAGVSK